MEICLGVKHIIGRMLIRQQSLQGQRDRADGSWDSVLRRYQAVGTKQKQPAKLLNSLYADN